MGTFSNWNLAQFEQHNARFNPQKKGEEIPSSGGVEVSESEKELHKKILDECNRRGWIALHGSMAHRSFRNLGEPDFVILADKGRLILVEAKTAKGKLSIEQEGMALWASKLGHTIHTCRSFEQFLNLC